MGSTRRKAEKSYLKLPGSIRGLTDPIVKNRGRIKTHVSNRSEKGGKTVKNLVSKFLYNPKARRKRR